MGDKDGKDIRQLFDGKFWEIRQNLGEKYVNYRIRNIEE